MLAHESLSITSLPSAMHTPITAGGFTVLIVDAAAQRLTDFITEPHVKTTRQHDANFPASVCHNNTQRACEQLAAIVSEQ